MNFGAAWLIWSTLVGSTMTNFVAGVHVDSDRLRLAARGAGIPEIVMEGIAAVETGYRGGNEFLGKAGEIGRMQIKESTAHFVGCGEPVTLTDYDYSIACGAKILRFCRDKYQSWDVAVRCYQGMAVPESTKDYLLKFQREVGRQALAQLDVQQALADAKAAARKAARAKKALPSVPPPAFVVDSVAKAVAQLQRVPTS